jgi:iron complex transport system substrate-binding protein
VIPSPTSPARRRRILAAALAMILAGGGACGSQPEASPGTAAAPTGEGAFPVTIAHRYGETTLTARPARVVTVGLTDHDAVLALGVVPVGVTEWFGGHPSAVWPWAQDELGGARPEVVGAADGIGFEKIAALAPDVILALYAGLSPGDYDKLSQIAPTVAQPAAYVDYGVPWDEQTLTAGRALGESARAERAVGDVERRLDDARARHPEFAGATGLVVSPYGGTLSVYAPQDARGRLLAELGFTQPPEIAELAGKEFSADLSYERIGLLDVDALVWIVNSVETDRPRFQADPLYAALAVHRDRHDTFVENEGPVGGALSFQSVLSLPLLIDDLVPRLAAAVKGDGGR